MSNPTLFALALNLVVIADDFLDKKQTGAAALAEGKSLLQSMEDLFYPCLELSHRETDIITAAKAFILSFTSHLSIKYDLFAVANARNTLANTIQLPLR